MRALLDVNMLLALFDLKHLHHAKAKAWWDREQVSGWASCPISQNGFLRIVSQKSYSNPIALADAIGMLRGWTDRSDHIFLPDDFSVLDRSVIDHTHMLGPRQITDIYLLALAVKNNGRLVTLVTGIEIGRAHV